MKKILLVIALLVVAAIDLQAQTKPQTPPPAAAPVNPLFKGRQLTSQLVAGLDASSFLNSWTSTEQSQWFSGLTKVPDASSLAKSISTLTEFIKPEAFKEGFSLVTLRGQASEAKNYGDVANVLGNLEANIKPESYKGDWLSKEPSWLSELKLVK